MASLSITKFRATKSRQYLLPSRPTAGGEYVPCKHTPLYKPFRKKLDVQVVLNWLEFCQEHHTTHCAHQPSDVISGLKVIDCQNRRVITAPADCHYVALSYLWGPSNGGQRSSRNEDFDDPESLPQTVRDAMTVVEKLGLRYLWVDRFCIDQDDPNQKHRLIGCMDMVYQGATLTIIAAAGNNPSYGLPGVSRPFPIYRSATLRDGCQLVRLPNPTDEIQQSKWSCRGWTYQEGLLSRRRLVFTDYQVYFQCQTGHFCENWQVSLSDLHDKRGSFSNQIVHFQHFPRRGLGVRPQSIFARINEYAVRTLTYPSDSLQAFLGILRAYQKMKVPTYHLWGMPVFESYLGSSGRPRRFFLQDILLWGVWVFQKRRVMSMRLSRVPGLPSWSWTGWRGYSAQEKCLPFPDIDVLLSYPAKRTVGLLFDENRSGQPSQWAMYETVAALYTQDTFQQVSPCLVVRGWTTTVKLLGPSKDGMHWIIREADNGPVKEFRLVLDAVFDKRFERRLLGESWTVLIVFWADKYDSRPPLAAGLLLEPFLEKGPDAYARAGVFTTSWTNFLSLSISGNPDTDQVQMGNRLYVRRDIRLF